MQLSLPIADLSFQMLFALSSVNYFISGDNSVSYAYGQKSPLLCAEGQMAMGIFM